MCYFGLRKVAQMKEREVSEILLKLLFTIYEEPFKFFDLQKLGKIEHTTELQCTRQHRWSTMAKKFLFNP